MKRLEKRNDDSSTVARRGKATHAILLFLSSLLFALISLRAGNNVIFMNQEKENHPSIWLPTVVLQSTPPTNETAATPTKIPPAETRARSSKDYTKKEFWRFDEAGPEIQKSKVHFLSSVPEDFRLTLDTEEVERNVTKALDLYASNLNNTYPRKHHLGEFNPAIAKLPESYLSNKNWLQAFGDNMPIYIATYRVSNFHHCLAPGYKDPIQFNYNYSDWYSNKPKTDFLGVALLNHDLDMIADVTYEFGEEGVFAKGHEDYRIFNLRGGDSREERLYLSTFSAIVPIELTLGTNVKPLPGYEKPRTPAIFPPRARQALFELWHRKKPTCTNVDGKNFMYFDELVKTNGTSHSEARLVVFPKGNPNEVIPIDLDSKKRCKFEGRKPPSYMKDKKPPFPEPAFRTMEEEMFPGKKKIFSGERGSACCFRVPKDEIPIASSMTEYISNTDETLMIALVHFRTGLHRPKSIEKRLYLSRFIAFLPHAPYTIVARSGGFCLGALTAKEDSLNHPKYHEYIAANDRMVFGTERLDGCPKIHFPMSMIEKVRVPNTKEEEESIIISYGVNDCFSRFVEVKKADIVDMFRGNYTTT